MANLLKEILSAPAAPGREEIALPLSRQAEVTTGRIHSFESCGAVDGPGIRFVVYMQGCPLHCVYCHNPDTRQAGCGEAWEVDALMAEIRKYRYFFEASKGGVTISGGEPLLQHQFVTTLLRRCKDEHIHTALDTCGYMPMDRVLPAVELADMFLLDIKSWNPETHYRVTGVYPERIRSFAHGLADLHKPIWVRFVLVPGLTDQPANIEGVARFAASLGCVDRVDVLPFHKMGEYKWQSMGLPYTLKDVEPPTREQTKAAVEVFRAHGLIAC